MLDFKASQVMLWGLLPTFQWPLGGMHPYFLVAPVHQKYRFNVLVLMVVMRIILSVLQTWVAIWPSTKRNITKKGRIELQGTHEASLGVYLHSLRVLTLQSVALQFYETAAVVCGTEVSDCGLKGEYRDRGPKTSCFVVFELIHGREVGNIYFIPLLILCSHLQGLHKLWSGAA